MEEIWKDIDGFDGKYQISTLGRVRSFAKKKQGRILKTHISKGYEYVGLYKKGAPTNSYLVHRLVAKAFVLNPKGFTEVNHKDENKLNNNAENLEWCSREYNMSYGTGRLRQGITRGNPVNQLAIDGTLIAIYCSANMAGEINGIDTSSIIKCCNNHRKYAGGFMWSYSNTSFC